MGGLPQCILGYHYHPLGAGTPQKQAPPPPEQSMIGDTVNKQVVRILLECNLVFTCVCDSVHRGGGVCPIACWDTPPSGPETGIPLPRPEAGTPRSRHPPGTSHTPPRTRGHPPGAGTPPPPRDQAPTQHSACWDIRATSGQHTSYWNAILFLFLQLFKIYFGWQLI